MLSNEYSDRLACTDFNVSVMHFRTFRAMVSVDTLDTPTIIRVSHFKKKKKSWQEAGRWGSVGGVNRRMGSDHGGVKWS